MYRILLFLLIGVSVASCEPSVQGNGKVKSETRETAPFQTLDISGAFDVQITQADYSSLKIEADENLHQYIESYVEDGVLYVSSTRRIGRSRARSLVISLADLEGIDASGASEFKTAGVIRGEKLKLDFSGAVEADLQLDYDEVMGDFSGAAELDLRGNASTVTLDASGAVEVNATDFKTQKFRLEISGAGEADIFVTEELEIEASGAVEVRYKGNPKKVTRNVSGAASIEPM